MIVAILHFFLFFFIDFQLNGSTMDIALTNNIYEPSPFIGANLAAAVANGHVTNAHCMFINARQMVLT